MKLKKIKMRKFIWVIQKLKLTTWGYLATFVTKRARLTK